MTKSIFSETWHLLEEVEGQLVSDLYHPIRIIRYLKRLIWLPVKFLQLGISERMNGLSAWTFLSFAFLLLSTTLLNKFEIKQPEIVNAVLFSACVVPMFIVLFALPSIFAHSGVNNQTIAHVCAHLRRQGFSKLSEVELLKKTIKLFEDRARSRITTFKLVVGIGWGGFTIIFSKGIETSLASSAQLMSHLFTSSLMLLAIGATYLCVWGYEAAIDKLFATIECGLNEYAHIIENESPSS